MESEARRPEPTSMSVPARVRTMWRRKPLPSAKISTSPGTSPTASQRVRVRIVVVTWAQSFVRDGPVREMLFDLRRAIEQVEGTGAPPEAVNLLLKMHTNLYRRFAET